jgi:hypothetical protein
VKRCFAAGTGWGLAGAAYGLLVSFHMDLAATFSNSLLLMAYVGGAFFLLGCLLFLLRFGVRTLQKKVRGASLGRKAEEDRPFFASVISSLGWFFLLLSLMLAFGDVLLLVAFQEHYSIGRLLVRVVLYLSCGVILCWWLLGPCSRRASAWLGRGGGRLGGGMIVGFAALLCCIALLGCVFFGKKASFSDSCGHRPGNIEADETHLRLLLFGLDGAAWSVLEPLMREGTLPTIERLIQQGASGKLYSPPPQVSPAVWTTIVTGQNPEIHGVREYILVSMPGLDLFPFEALAHNLWVIPFGYVAIGYFLIGVAEGLPPGIGQVHAKTLWQMANDAGKASLLLGWPCTWPAESIRGMVLTDRFGPTEWDMFSRSRRKQEGVVYPPDAHERIRPLIVDSKKDPRRVLFALGLSSPAEVEALIRYTYNPLVPSPMELLTGVVDADRTFLNVMEQELRLGGYSLGLIMLNGMDLTMHVFLGERFPERFGRKSAAHPEWGKLIDSTHAFVDRRLGEILRVSGENTVLILVSDHGMRPDPGNLIWPGWHDSEAVLIMAGGPVRQGIQIERMEYVDLLPTMAYLLGLPVPAGLPGKVRTDLIEPEFLRRFPVRSLECQAAELP